MVDWLVFILKLSDVFSDMRNAGLEEAQAGIKIAGRNINNLRYADDNTLMAEIEEELKNLLMKVADGRYTYDNTYRGRLARLDEEFRQILADCD